MIRLLFLFISVIYLLSCSESYAQYMNKNAVGLEVGRFVAQLALSGPRHAGGGNLIIIPELIYQRSLSERFAYRAAIGYTNISTSKHEHIDHEQYGVHTKQGVDYKAALWGRKHEFIVGVAGYAAYQRYETLGHVRDLNHYQDYSMLVYSGQRWFGGWEIATRIKRRFSDAIFVELSARLGFIPNTHAPLYRNYLTGFGHRLGSGDGYLKPDRNWSAPLDIYPGFDVRLYYAF